MSKDAQKRAAGKPQNSEAVKIACLQFENVKRVQAVQIVCEPTGLTLIGGRNGQGKTSVLDGIMWTLGGDRFKPTNPNHKDRDKDRDAETHIELSNGITVERKGKNGALRVMGPNGKGGQSLLNEFVNTFALNLPKFMQVSGTEKARMLLDVFPDLGRQLDDLNAEMKMRFDERHALGVIASRKQKHAESLDYYPDVPKEPLSGQKMAKRMQEALAQNARNDALRHDATRAGENVEACEHRERMTAKRVEELKAALADAEAEQAKAAGDLKRAKQSLAAARATAQDLEDEDATAIEQELAEIEDINAKVRQNQQKAEAEADAEDLQDQYQNMTIELDAIRAKRIRLLSEVDMPLDGLSINEEGDLVFNGQTWDGMSGSEQLRVATAICAAVKPECGFVLLDKLEAMDIDTLFDFNDWLRDRGLQGIGTRVSTGDECAIVIEDGMVSTPELIRKRKEYKF